jgi:hypothetical protein
VVAHCPLISAFQCTSPAAPALSARKLNVGAVIRYRTYIKPNCSPKETILVSRICVVAFGCLMGILAVLLNVAGVSLGWVRCIQLSAAPPPRNGCPTVVRFTSVSVITSLPAQHVGLNRE